MMLALAQQLVSVSGKAVSAGAALPVPTFAANGSDLAEKTRLLTDELIALQRDHGKLQQAIFEAAQIQRRLCAPRELSWGEYEVAGEIFPVRHLSGDFFKLIKFGSALGVILGDIAGKGFTAGIWQAHLMGLVQRAARRHASPADAIAEVNRELCSDENEPPIMALFFARIDQKNNLKYCNAGLPAPLLLRAKNKALERLNHGGPMLGAAKDAEYGMGSVALNSGDMLVAYSDGVTECRNAAEDEFEMERLMVAAKAVSGVNANKALFSLLGTVLDFAQSSSPADDLTVLVVRRRDGIADAQGRRRKRDSSASHRRASVPRPRNFAEGGPVSNS
jgi:serine phosphatase RsbU (regulator of sigma subunit)